MSTTTEVDQDTNGATGESPDESWDLIIRPKRHLFDVNLKELWDYRDLLQMLVIREVITVYKQTILGPIWFFLQPLLTMLVYIVVFGNIANISTDGIPRPLFYLSGIIIWNFFAESFNRTSATFTANAELFGKVYFPRILVPLSLIASNFIKLAIQFSLFCAVLAYFRLHGVETEFTVWIVAIPLLVVLMGGLALGFGILFSSLTTKYRDMTFLVQFGVQLAMYATPIVYPMSTLSPRLETMLWWNPISHIVEAFRAGLLGAGDASLVGLCYSAAFTAVFLTIGYLTFARTERNFIDTA